MENIEELFGEPNRLQLNYDSRPVPDTIAGYIVHQIEYLYRDCCQSQLSNKEVNTEYIGQLSRGGLKNPSMPLSTMLSIFFAALDTSSPAIRFSNIPARKA